MTPQSEMARVKALGSAHEGAGHWKLQRLTSISNLIVVTWLILFVLGLSGAGYPEIRTAVAHPFNATMATLLVISTVTHARLGTQVIIEDYVHHQGAKIASLIALTLAAAAVGVTCIVAILKIALGSP